ncbi:MAG: FtsQ-type POTRA domain-containing protein [Eggerthellaceae bacterium]
MASNSHRKSASSASRKAGAQRRSPSVPARSGGSGRGVRMPQTNPRRKQGAAPPAPRGRGQQQAGYNPRARSYGSTPTPVRSVRVGDMGFNSGHARAQASYRRYLRRLAIIALVVAVVVGGGVALYTSSLFPITNVSVQGVKHLTTAEMTQLASVPATTTLLRVDAAGIKGRLLQNAWVKDASVNRVFPETLELAITERTIAAVAHVPVDNGQSMQDWAISSDGVWLMVIPPQDSEEGKATSPQVYLDVVDALSILDVPYGVSPKVGSACTDASILNALKVIDGMTTSLKDQVKSVSATGGETTTLTLDSGIQIAFGTPENIREKERICLQLIEENPGKIAYINVRVVDRPTWRSI